MHGYSHVLSCAHVAVPYTHVKDDGKTTLSKEVRRLLSSHRDLSGQKARWTSARATRRKEERETKQHPMYIDMHLTPRWTSVLVCSRLGMVFVTRGAHRLNKRHAGKLACTIMSTRSSAKHSRQGRREDEAGHSGQEVVVQGQVPCWKHGTC